MILCKNSDIVFLLGFSKYLEMQYVYFTFGLLYAINVTELYLILVFDSGVKVLDW